MQLNKNSYIAGLFEGDGHISISPKKSYNPRFNITFNSKDLETALLIKSWFEGYGFIRYKTSENAIVYTVSNIKGLLLIIPTLNGKLRTPKIRQLYNCIDYLNEMGKDIPKLNKEPIDISPIGSNSWLAGFIDADGSFDIRYTDGLRNLKIATRLRIDQRKLDPITGESYEPIFNKISEYLGIPKVNYRSIEGAKGPQEYLNISASSQKSILILKDYLNKNSLITSKYLNYKDWEKVSEMILAKEHLNKKEEIKLIKGGMNNKRKIINMDHIKEIKYI